MDPFGERRESKPFPVEPVSNRPQYISALAVTIFVFIAGNVLGWTSPTLPILLSENSSFPVTQDEATWIGSLTPLGAIVGPFPGGISADIIGRKNSMLTAGVMLLVSWSILAAAQNYIYVYVGRLLAGFAMGWGMAVQPMYLGEISTPNVRGALGVLGQIQICLGFLYVYSLGPIVSYTWLCILCGAACVVFFLLFVWMPESPYYLVLKNDLKGATRALKKLRGQSTEGVKEELSLLQTEVEHSLRNKGTWKDTFMQHGNRKAIFVILSLMALQQFCGINAVLFYSETIFKKAGSNLAPSSCTIVTGVVMTVVSFFVPYLVEKMGRRPSIVCSAFPMGIALAGMGAFFYLDHIKYDVSSLSWLPLGSMILFIAAYSIGVGPIPWLLISEVFAPNIRSNGAAFSSSSSWLMAFFVTKLFQPVEVLIGSHGAFWVFAAVSFLGAVLSYFYLPETKGKTLQEIQILMNKK